MESPFTHETASVLTGRHKTCDYEKPKEKNKIILK